jgi:two-component system chemotaxis response regulator CheY
MAKILIVEDDVDLRDVYKEQFEIEKFEVETAVDGQDGILKMLSFRPDLVLLDILMPKMSGFDVLKKRKENPELKAIPVIVITNIYADAQDLVQNWGASFVLLKVDYTPGELVKKARALLYPPAVTDN